VRGDRAKPQIVVFAYQPAGPGFGHVTRAEPQIDGLAY
jgi:hypothetical protein